MARAIWTGSIGFGLVNIPVRLYNATVPMTVRFHEFERETGRRIRHRRVVEEAPTEPGEREPAAPPPPTATKRAEPIGEQEEMPARARAGIQPGAAEEPEPQVAYQDVVKGYEVEPGRFVMLTPEELRSLRPERTRTIEIQEFVDLDDIDPVHYDRSYYVSPGRGAGTDKPYSLLLRAMQRSRKVGIGSFVLTSRLHLAAVRPREDVLVLETLFYGDEVRPVAELDRTVTRVEPSGRELEVAVRLIELLGAEWDPSRYRDAYREKVLELIASRAPEAGALEQATGAAEPASGVADLMAALQASVEAARGPRRSRSRRSTG